MSWSFPNELVDAVIDHNHDERTTLLASALVSRQWTPAARYHLFSTVDITHSNAREFIELLKSPYCTLLGVLSGLNVEVVAGSQRWFSEFSRHLSTINRVNIITLKISGSRSTSIRESFTTALSYYYRHIKHFELGAVVFDSFAVFAAILCSFTELESLSCASTFRDTSIPGEIQFVGPLQSLALESPSIQPIFVFLLDRAILPTVTSISLSQLAVEDYTNLTRFLALPNGSLHSLNIKLNANFSGVTLDNFTEGFKLTQLRVLHHLIIDSTPTISPSQAFDILSTAKMPTIQLKTLHISLQLVQGVAEIDILLTSDKFAALESVIILGSSWDEIRTLFPRCDAKNILKQHSAERI